MTMTQAGTVLNDKLDRRMMLVTTGRQEHKVAVIEKTSNFWSTWNTRWKRLMD